MAENAPSISHLSVKEKGYRPIPIIPPEAPLSPDSRIRPQDRGKIPGRRNKAGHWSGYDWLNHKATDRELEKYTKDGAGIGVVCGEPGGVVALDIDCPCAETANWVIERAHEQLGWAPVRVGQPPKAVLVYGIDAMSERVSWRKVEFRWNEESAAQLVEVRGHGQQFVAYGTHPKTGMDYEWDGNGLPVRSQLTSVDADEIAQFFTDLEAELDSRGGETLRATSGNGTGERGFLDQSVLTAETERLDEALAHIPNNSEQFPSRDDYIRMGCAIKAAYADDPDAGYQAWLDWAYRWEDGTHGEDEPENDWERMKPPFEIGANWLFQVARDNGYRDADRFFQPIADASGGDDSDTGDDTATEFWNRYVWVEQIERFVDLHTKQFLSKTQFSVRFPHVGSGIQSNNNAAVVYLENPGMRTVVQRTTYRPGADNITIEDGESAVNTWRPGPAFSGKWSMEIRVDDDDVAPFIKLVTHLYPDEQERNLLLDWLAFQIQYPGVKCTWHPVIGGKQGVGKDSLVLPLLHGLGSRYNTTNISPSDLHSSWSDWVDGTQLLVVQEMNNFSRKETMDRIKPLMAEPPEYLRVNVKNMPQYEVPNIVNIVFFTNHRDAIALEQGDRRFFVLWSDAKSLEPAFYQGYYKWLLKRGGAADVCRWLNQRDLSGFNPAEEAPQTVAKEEMRKAAMSPVASTLEEAIAAEDGMFNGRDLFTSKELNAWVLENVRGSGVTTNGTAVARALREMGAEKLGRYRIEFDQDDGTGNGRQYVWAVRDADDYKRLDGESIKAMYSAQLKRASSRSLGKKFRRRDDQDGSDGDDDDLSK